MDVVLVGALEGNAGTIRRIGIGTNHKALTLGMRSLQQKHEKKNSKKDTLALARWPALKGGRFSRISGTYLSKKSRNRKSERNTEKQVVVVGSSSGHGTSEERVRGKTKKTVHLRKCQIERKLWDENTKQIEKKNGKWIFDDCTEVYNNNIDLHLREKWRWFVGIS